MLTEGFFDKKARSLRENTRYGESPLLHLAIIQAQLDRCYLGTYS